MKNIKLFKIILGFFILALIFNFSLAKAQEESVPVDGPNTTVVIIEDGSVKEESPINGAETETLESAAGSGEVAADGEPTELESTNTGEQAVPAEEIISSEPVAESQAATSAPIIFDFPAEDSTATSSPVCGNGILEESETCDDNNLEDRDGCNGACLIEASTNYEVNTGISRSLDINNLTILAQWQMLRNEESDGDKAIDNSTFAGAQFLPSGQYEVSRSITVCAIIADSYGADNISSTSVEIRYPENIAIGENEVQKKIGCGQVKSEFDLQIVETASALELICEKLRNDNYNLIFWQTDKINNYFYNYEQICSQEGLLKQQKAWLYCADTELAYNDPAGEYKVKVSAVNNVNLTAEAESYLKYMELITFENDFSDIYYGLIKLNELKVLTGDNIFSIATPPTIRNTGNTRLQINIWQNDFNLGQTDGLWNLEYRAKVGEKAEFISYYPEEITSLNNPIDLGQTARADFAVLVKKFPENSGQASFAGKMVLGADKAPALNCK